MNEEEYDARDAVNDAFRAFNFCKTRRKDKLCFTFQRGRQILKIEELKSL